MARFNLDEYVTVAERITRFWELYPEGAIRTEWANAQSGELRQFVVKAVIFRHHLDPHPAATGYAEETKLDSTKGLPNESSPLENCESSAIGRALRNMGFGVEKPSREEMAKVNRMQDVAPDLHAKDRQLLVDKLSKFADVSIMTKTEAWSWAVTNLERKVKTVSDLTIDEIKLLCTILDSEM